MAKEPFRVTDHAVIRYLERAMDLNIDIVRQHIESICKGPAELGAVAVRAEGVRFEIRNNAVLTVAPDRVNPSNIGRAIVQDQIQRQKREQENDHRALGIRGARWPVVERGSDGAGCAPVADPGPAGFGPGFPADGAEPFHSGGGCE